MNERIFDKIVRLNIPYDHHEADLYISVTEQTQDILSRYEWQCNVTTFKNQIDGKPWFDIPFAYLPYWKRAEGEV